MANSAREATTTLIQPMSPPPPPQNSSVPHFTSLASANLGATTIPRSLFVKHVMSPNFSLPPLTGAAAMAENHRHKEEMERRKQIGTSPNPARTAFMSAASPGMSRIEDAPKSPNVFSPKSVPSIVTEAVHMDLSRGSPMLVSSPVQMGASPALPAPTPAASSISSVNSKKRRASPIIDERALKAMTYPPAPSADDDDSVALRNTSFPDPSLASTPARSPLPVSSSKKHKCPHCTTEFTRHHNLKSHLLTHSQEKPFACDQCTSRFRRLHDLKRHVKLHTGERPHNCMKCGRRFARGDALARHNKGPGGCAGRRGSGGDGDDFGDGESEVDRGPSYEGEDGGHGGGGDDGYADSHRRQSEPDRGRHESVQSTGATASTSYHHHSSTYPGIAPMSSIVRSLHPPPTTNQSTSASPRPMSRQHSPGPSHGNVFSAVQYTTPSPMPLVGMTESPRPLSPRQPDVYRHTSGAPSISSQLQQTRLSHGGAGSSISSHLPPAMTLGTGPQLPSLTALTESSRFTRTPIAPPVVHPPPIFAAHPPSSADSHHQNSGGNMREPMGSAPATLYSQTDVAMWEHARELERRLAESAMRLEAQRAHYEDEISRLREEVAMLRGSGSQQQPTRQLPQR